MKNVIFLAPPAAGKGTQSKLVSEAYNIPHISTGDLLREEVMKGTPLGKKVQTIMAKGELVQDEIIAKLLENRIRQKDCQKGYILDGYPRNLNQAKSYDKLLKKLNYDRGVVIFLDILKELALERTLSRLVCPHCGALYNLMTKEMQPKVANICDKCHHPLKTRDDDNREVFLKRFDIYMDQTKELIDYYDQLGVLYRIKISDNNLQRDFQEVKRILDDQY